MSDGLCHPDLEAALEAFVSSCEAAPRAASPRRGGASAARSTHAAAALASPQAALVQFKSVLDRVPGGRLPEPLLARLLALLARPRLDSLCMRVIAPLLEQDEPAARQLGTPAAAAAVWAAAQRVAPPAWDPEDLLSVVRVLGLLLLQPGSDGRLLAVHRELAAWLQQAIAAARAGAGNAGQRLGVAATALHELALLLGAAGDAALALRCARSAPLMDNVAWLADEAAAVEASSAEAPPQEFMVGVSLFVSNLTTVSLAAADAMGASPAAPKLCAALLRAAAARGTIEGPVPTAATNCLLLAMSSLTVTAAVARELARTVVVGALRSDSEVERVCVCRALLCLEHRLDNDQPLPAPVAALLAERGLAAWLVSALRRPEQSGDAALAAAAAVGMVVRASRTHALARPVADAVSALAAADAAALGGLSRAAGHCAVWAPQPGHCEAQVANLRNQHTLSSALAVAALEAVRAACAPAAARGLASTAARWLAHEAGACELPCAPDQHLPPLVNCLMRFLTSFLMDSPPAAMAAGCAVIVQAAPGLPSALARLTSSPPPPQAQVSSLYVAVRAFQRLLESSAATTSAAPSAQAAGGSLEAAQRCCAHCGRGEDAAAGVTLKRCGGCRSRRYCDAACAKAAWAAGHKAECKQLAAAYAAASASAARE